MRSFESRWLDLARVLLRTGLNGVPSTGATTRNTARQILAKGSKYFYNETDRGYGPPIASHAIDRYWRMVNRWEGNPGPEAVFGASGERKPNAKRWEALFQAVSKALGIRSRSGASAGTQALASPRFAKFVESFGFRPPSGGPARSSSQPGNITFPQECADLLKGPIASTSPAKTVDSPGLVAGARHRPMHVWPT